MRLLADEHRARDDDAPTLNDRLGVAQVKLKLVDEDREDGFELEERELRGEGRGGRSVWASRMQRRSTARETHLVADAAPRTSQERQDRARDADVALNLLARPVLALDPPLGPELLGVVAKDALRLVDGRDGDEDDLALVDAHVREHFAWLEGRGDGRRERDEVVASGVADCHRDGRLEAEDLALWGSGWVRAASWGQGSGSMAHRHGIEVLQRVQVAAVELVAPFFCRLGTRSADLAAQPVLDLGVAREAPERPRQGCACRLVSGKEEGLRGRAMSAERW